MKYSRFSDPMALLLSGLCSQLTKEELSLMSHIAHKMHNNPEFERSYTLEVKSRYLSNIQAIKNNTYPRQSFEQLNFEICERIASRESSPAILLPEYAKIDNSSTNKQEIEHFKKQITKIYKSRFPDHK